MCLFMCILLEKRDEYVQPDSDGLHQVLDQGNQLYKKGIFV